MKEGRYKVKGREENLRQYGITLSQYNRIFELQNGLCGICSRPQSDFKNKFAVDHNHKTGVIRGLLCVACNIKLELFENHKEEVERYLDNENIKIIRRMVKKTSLF